MTRAHGGAGPAAATAARARSDLTASADFDVVVVGAGFGGLYALHRLTSLGLRVHIFEAAGDVGGVWYWNRYPGARCDVESMEYSFSFDDDLQLEWEWTERYAAQPEILAYARHVADRFRLRPDISFNTRIRSATWDQQIEQWRVEPEVGEPVLARFLVMATGSLSVPQIPSLPGLGEFTGTILHPARWPHDGVDLAGKRVAVIGNGSTAIQLIPVIADQADQLFVLQRTAAYTVPARNRPLDAVEVADTKRNYREFRARSARMPAAHGASVPLGTRKATYVDSNERQRVFEEAWNRGGARFLTVFTDLMTDMKANDFAASFVRAKIRDIVQDRSRADLLMPRQVIGCKRLCLDTNYYETFNRSNVHLASVRDNPIVGVTRTGIRTTEREIGLDIIILATGFDAMTGALNAIDIKGRDGRSLREKWRHGARTYLGLSVSDFPNMFIITGPGSPSVLANMITAIEQHVDWIADCLRFVQDAGKRTIEATAEAETAWVRHVNDVAAATLYTQCNSWYLGANIPGKERVFLPLVGGFPAYVERCNAVASAKYEGFVLGPQA